LSAKKEKKNFFSTFSEIETKYFPKGRVLTFKSVFIANRGQQQGCQIFLGI
jgi:hypothetical protein